MSAATDESSGFTVIFSEEERAQLLSVLEQAFRDTHAEARRTDAPAYQEQIHHQEALLRRLIEKLRRP